MPQAHFNQAAAEMLGAATVYAPEGMMQVGRDFSGFADAFDQMAQALGVMAKRANDEFPMADAILDQLQSMYADLRQVAALGRELQPMFRKLHADDIQRISQPRRGEQMWDVSANRDYLGGAL